MSTLSTTARTASALALAAILSLALFLSPVGISSAQDEATDEPTSDESTGDEPGSDESTTETAPDDGADRPGRGDLTDEEREALRAEREAEQQAFLDDVASELGVTADELVGAFKSVAIARVEAKVEAGDLTEERGADLIERIEASDGLPRPGGRHGHGPRGHGGHGGHGGPGGAPADGPAAEGGEI